MTRALLASVSGVGAPWVASAALVALAGGRGALLARAPLALAADAFGGQLRYAGPLVDDPGGVSFAGFPLTLTLLGVTTFAVVQRQARPQSAARAATLGVIGAVALAALAVCAAILGRHHQVDANGEVVSVTAGLAPALIGGLAWGCAASAVAFREHLPWRWPMRWRGPIRAAALALAAPWGLCAAAGLVTLGYAAGEGGPGRVAFLIATAPNLAVLLGLLAFGAPIAVHAPGGSLLSEAPIVGLHVRYAGPGHAATLSLFDLADARHIFLLLPVAAAATVVPGAIWLGLRSTRWEAPRSAAAFGIALAGGIGVAAVLDWVAADGGNHSSSAVVGTVHAAPAWAVVTAAAWAAAGAVVVFGTASMLPPALAQRLRESWRIPAPPPAPPAPAGVSVAPPVAAQAPAGAGPATPPVTSVGSWEVLGEDRGSGRNGYGAPPR